MRESALRAHDLKNQKSLTFENKSLGSRTTQTTQFWNVRLQTVQFPYIKFIELQI